MKKKFGAFGAGQFSLGTLVGGQPGTTIFQNPGGGGGGWGVSHTRTGPGRPPGAPALSGLADLEERAEQPVSSRSAVRMRGWKVVLDGPFRRGTPKHN